MDTASVNDTERYFILDLNAIPMLKYRSLKKIYYFKKSHHKLEIDTYTKKTPIRTIRKQSI